MNFKRLKDFNQIRNFICYKWNSDKANTKMNKTKQFYDQNQKITFVYGRTLPKVGPLE